MWRIKRIAIVGLGALGACYANAMLCHPAKRCIFALVRHTETYEREPLTVNGIPLVIPMFTASDWPEPVDLILLTVKWHHLSSAMEGVARMMGPHTQILSLLNGITSEEVLARRFGDEHVLYCTVCGADTRRKGHEVITEHLGELCFGEIENKFPSERVAAVAQCLQAMKIPYRIAPDMRLELWKKLMVNVGINQVGAVLGLNYGRLRHDHEALDLMHSAQQEVLQIAHACGVSLKEADIQATEQLLHTLSENGMSSTLQDITSKQKTEVELYGGEVSRLGLQYGIPTPVNDMLLEQICRLEKGYFPGV